MKYTAFDLFRDEDVSVRWIRSGKPTSTLFITFTPAPWRTLDDLGFGGKYLLEKGFDVLAIQSSWAHYWRPFAHDDLLERLTSLLSGFYAKRIGYGSSMGALGVYLFHQRLQLTHAICLSPRFVDLPNTLVKRPDSKIHTIKPLPTESSTRFYVLYDPYDKIDAQFIELTQLHTHPSALCLRLPFIGHPVGYALNELDSLNSLIERVIFDDPKGFLLHLKNAYRQRKKSSYYLSSVGSLLLKRRKPKSAIILAERALQILPDNMQATMLRYDALIAGGERTQVIAMYHDLNTIQPKKIAIETLIKSRMATIERRFGSQWLVQEANTKTSPKYEEIVKQHEQVVLGRKCIHLKRNQKHLIVSMTTHNNFEKYQSLIAFSDIPYDVLFITNPTNSYYLEDDLSASYFQFLLPFIEQYGAENILFFGSSMAGYGALRFALHFGANAIVCNAQVDFELTKKTCWPNLLQSINKISTTENLAQMIPKSNTFIHFAFGQHPMDLANQQAFESYVKKYQDLLHVEFVAHPTSEHSYLFGSTQNFLTLVEHLFKQRQIASNMIFS